MPHYLDPIPKTSVPYYNALRNYEWVKDFLEAGRIAQEIAQLRHDIRGIKNIAPTKDELLEALKRDFDHQRQQRIEKIARFIKGGGGKKGIRTSLHGMKYDHVRSTLFPNLDWDEIVAAVEYLNIDADSPDRKQRAEEIDTIKGELAKLEARMIECCPGGYHILENGVITDDSRKAFVDQWCSTQRKCNAPCGPTGRAISLSPGEEREAYYQLGIDKCINKTSHRAPHPGNLYMTENGTVRA